jgi:uncharacterized membrane protein
MKSLKKNALAVLALAVSPDVGLMISVALLVMIFIAAAVNGAKSDFAERILVVGGTTLCGARLVD